MTAKPLRGIHVFWIIFSFFAVTIAVNTLFVVRAVGTFPGEDVPNSYVQGNDYNATLERRAAQEKLGWSAQAGLVTTPEHGQSLVFKLVDADNHPVTGRNVEARLRLVGKAGEEVTLRLPEITPGEYANIFPVAGPGRLNAVVEVHHGDSKKIEFTATKALVLP